MTKLLDLLATGSVVTEEKQHLQDLREMINRLSPHRTPTITLRDTVIREEPTDSVSRRTVPLSILCCHPSCDECTTWPCASAESHPIAALSELCRCIGTRYV